MADKKTPWEYPISRRKFMAAGAATVGMAATYGLFRQSDGFVLAPGGTEAGPEEKIVPTAGGRCIIKAHVRDNRIVRISTDDDIPDTEETPQLRGCLRCRSYRDRLYHPDRLKYPMKRVGKRGEGKFKRITWDEALNIVADHTQRIMKQYGPEAVYLNYATGSQGKVAEWI